MKETDRFNASTPQALSRRDFIRVSVSGSLLLTLPAFGHGPGEHEEWWFVHISDTHSAGQDHADSLKFVLDDIRKAFPQTRFVLNTGDVTEHGWEEELDMHRKTTAGFPLPLFEVMGNHDSRWSRSGRYAYRQRFGATRWAIEHEFLSVFALDCSVLMEQYGHLDPSELAWLEEQLKRVQGKASMVAFHHPPCTTGRYLDTDGDLFQLIAKYNVPAILGGHIHNRKEYQVNGTWVITAGAAMTPKSGYCAFRVRSGEATLFDRRPEEDQTRIVMSIPLTASGRKQPEEKAVSLQPKAKKGSILVALSESPAMGPYLVQLNGHKQEVKTDASGKALELDAAALAPGHYEVEWISPDAEAREQRRAWGRFYLPPKEPVNLRWQKGLKAGIQCAPAFSKDLLIVGSNDGRVQALDAKSGKSRWEYESGPDAILSSPVIHGGRVFFGTMDGHVVSLFADTGKLAWKGKVEGSVFATGRILGDPARFVVGTGKGRLVSLSAATGAVQWEYQAGNHIKATPGSDGERLFFGAWDGCFYALDAKTGSEAWKLKMNSPHFSPATCNPQVYEGKVIVVTHDYRTHCLDAKTGQHLWAFPAMDVDFKWNGDIVARCKPSYSSAVFYGGAAYLGSLTGHVVGFDLATGKQVLEAPVDDPIFDSFPVLQGDRMYFGTVGGTLYAFDLKAKAPAWKYSLGPHFIFAPPATDGKYLAIGDLAGQLACIEMG